MILPNQQPCQGKKWSLPLHITLAAALWASLILIFAMGLYLTGLSSPFPISLGKAAYQALCDWLPWILASPLILWLANRFRIEKHAWRSSLAIHFAAGLLLTLGYQGLLLHTRIGAPTMFVSQIGVGSPPPGTIIEGVASSGRHFTRVRAIENLPADHLFIGPPGSRQEGGFSVAISGGIKREPSQHFFHLALIRSQFTLPLYWAMVIGCWAASYYQQSRDRERHALELEASLSKANLHALKMQLQPHFLFNALNAISALVHQNPDAADEMLGSLSDLLRMSLEFSDYQEVTLEQELQFLDCYLSIQQARFGSRLRICKDVEPAALNVRVPTFLLQPFVENAVQHGIEPRKSGGTITLRAHRSRNHLQLEISDDGQGLAASPVTALKEGIGLSNSKARLRELYGANHQFGLKRNASGGVCVTLEIPLRQTGPHSVSPTSQSPNPA